MKARWISVVIAGLVVAAGCAEPPRLSDAEASEPVLFVRTAAGIEALGGGAGGVFPNGVAAPDFSVVVAAEAAGDDTVVRRVDSSGDELDRVVVDGRVVPRVVSRDGGLVALGAPRSVGNEPYLPEGRERTRIVVYDSGEPEAPAEFDLDGNFEPEAFSSDASELFVIEFLPAVNPDRYRVRRLKLWSGKVAPIGRLKNAAPEQMQGTGRTQVHSPGGKELYTLYTQQEEAGHAGAHIAGDQAFVHLLNLEEKWAHCIDLPKEFASGAATASALATSSDGRDLYVVDWSNGAVAVVRPRGLKVNRTVEVDFGAADEQTFARATENRLYVAGGSELVVLDVASLREVARWDQGGEIEGLNVAADGRTIFVSVGNEIRTLDATTGEMGELLPAAAAGAIEHVGAP